MKALAAKITKGLKVGSFLRCADNSGAKTLQLISIRGFKGKRRTKPSGGVANLVRVRIATGDQKLMHQVYYAVIIRQRKEYRRLSGIRIQFEDNAAALLDDKLNPTGTMIKGPVAKEAVERFSTLGKIASQVV